MANLNLYIGGTPGGTDGTLIDPAAGIDLSGLYIVGATEYRYIYLPLFIRCNPGFAATSVQLTPLNSMMGFLGQSGSIFTFDSWSSVDNVPSWGLSMLDKTSKFQDPSSPSKDLAKIGNTNIMFFVCAAGTKYTTNILQNALSISYVETAV